MYSAQVRVEARPEHPSLHLRSGVYLRCDCVTWNYRLFQSPLSVNPIVSVVSIPALRTILW